MICNIDRALRSIILPESAYYVLYKLGKYSWEEV